MRAAFDNNFAGALGKAKRKQHRLQREAGGAGAAALARFGDVEAVCAGANAALRRKKQFCASERVAFKLCAADRRSGAHARQMLRSKAWNASLRANVLKANGAAGNGGKTKRGAQNLAAAFSVAAVNLQRAALHRRLRFEWIVLWKRAAHLSATRQSSRIEPRQVSWNQTGLN